jgi:hypothetical protein
MYSKYVQILNLYLCHIFLLSCLSNIICIYNDRYVCTIHIDGGQSIMEAVARAKAGMDEIPLPPPPSVDISLINGGDSAQMFVGK